MVSRGCACVLTACAFIGCGSHPINRSLDSGIPVQTWDAVTAPSSGAGFTGVAYGNGTWSAVGTGVVAQSPDGKTWTEQPVASSAANYTNDGVAFANGVFLTAGGQAVSTSPDGVNWTTQTLTNAQSLEAPYFGDGIWIVLDNHVTTQDVVALWTSPDGQSWSSVTTSVPYAVPSGVAYGNGNFVLVGQAGLVLTSPDAMNWTQELLAYSDNALMGIAFGGGQFIAVSGSGSAYTSTNGEVWSQVTVAATTLSGVCFGNNEWLTVGDGLFASAVGFGWTPQNLSVPSNGNFAACSWGNGEFITVGTADVFAESP